MPDKIKQLKDWFAPAVALDITAEKSNFDAIEWTTTKDSNGNDYLTISPIWFDLNVSFEAKVRGYDIVALGVEPHIWQGKQVQGFTTKPNMGVQEIGMIANEFGDYVFNGKKYEGGEFFNIVRHEICHAIYNMLGKTDNTHLYWTNGNIEKVLEEFKSEKKIEKNPGYKYFSPKEIIGLKSELVVLLDKARGIAGVPFVLTSGYRNPAKNKSVGGVEDSSHITGLAVDIRVRDGVSGGKILLALAQVGFTRFGFYKDNHIHVDMDTTKPSPCIWVK